MILDHDAMRNMTEIQTSNTLAIADLRLEARRQNDEAAVLLYRAADRLRQASRLIDRVILATTAEEG